MERVPLSELPEAERHAIIQQLTARAEAYAGYKAKAEKVVRSSPLWIPQPGPQLAAFLSPAQQLFFGGSAGGGKTDLIVGLSLTMHQRSIIFRREFPQAAAIEDRLKKLVGADDYNSTKHRWSNPQDQQHIVEIGSLPDENGKDLEKYRGRPYDLQTFDEVTGFRQEWISFLAGWNRSAEGVWTRQVLTGNPPETVDGEWVIDAFAPWLDDAHVNPARPGELRYFLSWQGVEIEVDSPLPWATDYFTDRGQRLLIWPQSRTFIPSRVSDNSFLAGTNYEASLSNLPEELRQKRMEGRFIRVRKDQPNQVVPNAWITAAMGRWKQRMLEQGEPEDAPQQVGVDVSRGGADCTVIARRTWDWIAELEVHHGRETSDGPKVAALALDGPHDPESTLFAVDVLGPGSSPVDSLVANNVNAYAVNGSERATRKRDRTKRLAFFNLRADMYWQLREELDPQYGSTLCLPPDQELFRELAALTYEVTTRGIKIESKDEIKKRLGRSTDRADAVAYSLLKRAVARTFSAAGGLDIYSGG